MALRVPPSMQRTSSSASLAFDIPTNRALQLRVDSFPEARTPGSAFHAAGELPDNLSPSYIVVSGGTGCNAICSAFGDDVCYVLPVSDNGGSSSEIIRVLGGPSIGDIRSRLIRLIPLAAPSSPTERIRRLLSHRLPADATEHDAREIWTAIVEGRSELWHGIPSDRKETIRGFLVYFDGEVLKRANKRFSFKNASIGNFLLTACHLFFRSVPSAIFLFSSITGSRADILPVLVTNHTVTIAAELENGRILVGQCEISHPSPSLPSPVTTKPSSMFHLPQQGTESDEDEEEIDDDWAEDALGGPEIAPVQNAGYTKNEEKHESLESPIQRLMYINSYGQEIHPSPNPQFSKKLNAKQVLVYSCGSLYTSIVPCLALKGVATSIATSRSLRAKVLLLNGTNDRETEGYTALDYIMCIANVLNLHDTLSAHSENGWPVSCFVTHLIYLRGTNIAVDTEEISALGVQCIEVESASGLLYDAAAVQEAMGVALSTINYESDTSS